MLLIFPTVQMSVTEISFHELCIILWMVGYPLKYTNKQILAIYSIFECFLEFSNGPKGCGRN